MSETRQRVQKDALAKIINKVMPPKERVEKAAELARGVTCLTHDTHGKEKVYERPPDIAALRFLEEYATGKPVQKTEITGEGGSAFACLVIPTQNFPKK